MTFTGGYSLPADAVVTSCGGFPKDISLYQGTKTIDNVESALKPGGTLVLMIEAPEGGRPRRVLRLEQEFTGRHH